MYEGIQSADALRAPQRTQHASGVLLGIVCFNSHYSSSMTFCCGRPIISLPLFEPLVDARSYPAPAVYPPTGEAQENHDLRPPRLID